MPNADRYRTLSREYAAKAERAASPLTAEGYRKLASGYGMLAEGQDALSANYRRERQWIGQQHFSPEPPAEAAPIARDGHRNDLLWAAGRRNSATES
jgi:hypothetical protein